MRTNKNWSIRLRVCALALLPFWGASAQAASILDLGDPALAEVTGVGGCSDAFSSSCILSKTVTGATQAIPHTMEIELIGHTFLSLTEALINGTSAPLTGYHLSFESLQIAGVEHGGFGDVVDFTHIGSATVTRHSPFAFSVDYVFATPVDVGGLFVLGPVAELTLTSGYHIAITQHPTFEEISVVPVPGSFGLTILGMVGFAVARRRKQPSSKADNYTVDGGGVTAANSCEVHLEVG